jgi:hypothetical protein
MTSAEKSIQDRANRLNWIWQIAAKSAQETEHGEGQKSDLIYAILERWPVTARTLESWFDTLESQRRLSFNHANYTILRWPQGTEHRPAKKTVEKQN